MDEQIGSSPESEAWREIVEAIVAGTEDQSAAAAFWVAVESRIWNIVLVVVVHPVRLGPAFDVRQQIIHLIFR